MRYLSEFRINFRPLAAAACGMGGGLALMTYSVSLFAPHLLKEFGWSKSDFALTQVAPMLMLLFVPVAGRVADLFGVRTTATIGAIGLPFTAIAFSLMTGSIYQYFAIFVAAQLLGAFVTSAIYTRLIAQRFEAARGLALSIVICAPATVVAIGSPIIAAINEDHGWRMGFRALAVLFAVLGSIALTLIPPRREEILRQGARSAQATLQDYKLIALSVPFWVIFMAMMICNIPQTLASAQLGLILVEKGIDAAAAGAMLSAYATGMIIGRFICGATLDRAPPHLVAAAAMALPAIGLFILGSDITSRSAAALSIVLLGLSQGAEGDLMAYLVARYFRIDLYSSTLGLVVGAVSVGASIGSVIMSRTLLISDSFSLFLYISTAAVLTGSALFLFLGKIPAIRLAPA